MKSAYVIAPGLQLPERFSWRTDPLILSQQDLWETMKSLQTGIVFRVRTERSLGETLGPGDRIESAVGLLDSTSRWRATLALIRIALGALRLPETAEACWNVFQMITGKHPAAVQTSERQQLATQLRMVIEKLQGDDPRAAYEASVAAMCMRLAFCDNDIEMAHVVPYGPIYMITADPGLVGEREATVDVLASGIFLSEAYARLAEKTPEWLYSKMPVWPGSAAVPAAPPAKPQDEDDGDGEG